MLMLDVLLYKINSDKNKEVPKSFRRNRPEANKQASASEASKSQAKQARHNAQSTLRQTSVFARRVHEDVRRLAISAIFSKIRDAKISLVQGLSFTSRENPHLLFFIHFIRLFNSNLFSFSILPSLSFASWNYFYTV